MKFEVTTPPTGRVMEWDILSAHLRLDSTDDQPYVYTLLDAVTDYAQEVTATSLLSQTITATYFIDDTSLTPAPSTFGDNLQSSALGIQAGSWSGRATALYLPRGPVTAVVSVTNAAGVVIDPTSYKLERVGHADRLRLNVAALYPVTVVYTAGYSSAAAVPASIKAAIQAHVGTLYERRESVSDKSLSVVPHSLDAFYKLRSRQTGIG